MLRTFEDVAADGRDLTVDADVVVVGSGAGGGAIAAELAEGGRSVVVVEEGGHYTSKDFSLDAPTMIKKLYRNAGAAPILGRPNIIFSEGRCVGGSTVINGAMSWRTPEKILKRWQWEHGLRDLSPKRSIHSSRRSKSASASARKIRIDRRGCTPHAARRRQARLRMGAGDAQSEALLRRQQLRVRLPPPTLEQSVLVTYVPRLLAAGGRLFSGCKIERVTTDGQRATGVVGRFRHPETGARGPRLTVRAKIVVLACGAVQTPALLLRNGLTNSSRQVGRNFLCHPNTKVVGIYDRPVHAWKGTIQGNQIREFLDEGIMITTTMVPPGLLAMSLPYFGARSWEVMQDYDKMVVAGCLVEDTGSGRVGLDLFGDAKMRYDVNDRDFHNLVRGVALTAEILSLRGRDAYCCRSIFCRLSNRPTTSRRCSRIRSRRTKSSASPCTRWAPAAWESTSVHRSSIRTARAGTCPASSSPTRACFPDRSVSIRRSRSWRSPRAPAVGYSTTRHATSPDISASPRAE